MAQTCSLSKLETKIKALPKPKAKRFKPLYDHLINLARDSAKRGYCQRAGIELRHARKVAGYT